MNLKCALFFIFLVPLIVVCIYLVMHCTTTDSRISKQTPNIVVIMADDLGWDDVSFHGSDEIPTPNIDALAYNGVILNRHYVLPTCTPSRTAFLTGRYTIRTGAAVSTLSIVRACFGPQPKTVVFRLIFGMQGFPLRGAEPRAIPLNNTLLPEHLRRLGYATHLVGKWHVGYQTRNHVPTSRGFDTFLGYFSGYIEYFTHRLVESGQSGYDIHRLVGDNHTVEYRYDYMTDLIADEAEKIILSHDPAKPLYLQLSHLAPHASTAEEILEIRSWREMNNLGYIKDVNRRKYASVVATLDESVGRVVDALRRADMLDNSIVVFMSDNGAPTVGELMKNFGSNYPLRGVKGNIFDGGVRVVACVYSPLIDSPSRVSTQLFHITDWLPTLYSAAGGDPSDLKDFDGVDQWAVIKNASKSKRQSFLVNIDEKTDSEAALMGQYKLIRDNSGYSEYYGYNSKNLSYPNYNVINVLTSPVASAIASISGHVLHADTIKQLREKSTVVCQNFDFSHCTNRTCLFDIRKDPCETTDVSFQYPQIVQKLSEFIDGYKLVLMKQTNVPVDPAGFPHNFNDTWMPWLPDDYQSAKCILRTTKLHNDEAVEC